jgi:alkanesulfonate monooxygenase SsuD/methylene tetrahydromethanopterin reductase-like flavin-dependent oxidoreductase (luciferase family)
LSATPRAPGKHGAVRLGVLLLPTDPWPETVARARHLEALGYAHLWTYDHLSWRRYREQPWFGAVPWLTGLAGATGRVRLGTMVASPTFRHPLTFAKEVMTLDHVSSGRVTIGLGAGGTGFDATVLGDAVLDARARVDRFAEFVAVFDRALREPVLSHRGRFYTVDDARTLPGCVQEPRVPIALAAGGQRTLTLTARYADAWITYGSTTSDDRSPRATERAVREQSILLDDACTAIGRDPASLDRIYLISNTDERPLASVETFREFVHRHETLGFTDIVFHDPRPGDPVWSERPEIVDAIAAAFT